MTACGVGADAAGQRRLAVAGVQGGNIVEDFADLVAHGCGRNGLHDFPDELLELDDVGGVERVLQGVDALAVDLAPEDAVLHVHDLQVGDGPPAVVEDFQHLLHAQIAQAQGDARCGVDVLQAARQLRGRKAEHGGRVRVVGGDVRVAQGGVARGRKIAVDDFVRIQFGQALDLLAYFVSFRPGGAVHLVPQLRRLPLQKRQQGIVDELAQVLQRSLARAHEAGEVVPRQGGQVQAVLPVQGRAVRLVEAVEHLGHVCLVVQRDLPGLGQKGLGGGRGQDVEELGGGVEAAGRPDELQEAAAQARIELDADAHLESQDARGFQKLGRGLPGDVVVVDHGEALDALDPGVEHKVRGGFAALGVGVVHMVVEGDLALVFRHFQQVVARQVSADDARLSGTGLAEVAGEHELGGRVPVGADHVLHELHQHAARVGAQAVLGRAQHLGVQAAKGGQAVLGLARFQRSQQVHHGISDAQTARGRHLLDAVRVHVGGQQLLVAGRVLALHHIAHDAQKVVILAVEIGASGPGLVKAEAGRIACVFFQPHVRPLRVRVCPKWQTQRT